MPTTKYLWDEENDSYLAETDEMDALTAAYTVEPEHFGRVVSEVRDEETSYHHYDALGSTRQLTDESGDVTDSMTYDAWGNIVAQTGTDDTPFLWNGEWGYSIDAQSGLYQVRRRPFTPVIARWASADILLFQDGMNLYGYSHNSPAANSDPSGEVTVTRRKSEFDTATCGDSPIVRWDFILDTTKSPTSKEKGAPCKGWLVQKVNVDCFFGNRSRGGIGLFRKGEM